MSEQRTCEGCGKPYWFPMALWQHKSCVVVKQTPVPVVVKQRKGDRHKDTEARREYMREYMKEYQRKVRAKAKGV